MRRETHNSRHGPLNPTLWRTCRALANRGRLKVLASLVERDGQTVTEVAEANGISLSLACQYLRALNARGILSARREGRWVRYLVAPNFTIPETTPLIEALRHDLVRGTDAVNDAFRDLTAFTHPRRIMIIRTLHATEGLTFGILRVRTGVSREALRRHIKKLVDRRFVKVRKGVYSCCRPPSQLARVLTMIAVAPQG